MENHNLRTMEEIREKGIKTEKEIREKRIKAESIECIRGRVVSVGSLTISVIETTWIVFGFILSPLMSAQSESLRPLWIWLAGIPIIFSIMFFPCLLICYLLGKISGGYCQGESEKIFIMSPATPGLFNG